MPTTKKTARTAPTNSKAFSISFSPTVSPAVAKKLLTKAEFNHYAFVQRLARQNRSEKKNASAPDSQEIRKRISLVRNLRSKYRGLREKQVRSARTNTESSRIVVAQRTKQKTKIFEELLQALMTTEQTSTSSSKTESNKSARKGANGAKKASSARTSRTKPASGKAIKNRSAATSVRRSNKRAITAPGKTPAKSRKKIGTSKSNPIDLSKRNLTPTKKLMKVRATHQIAHASSVNRRKQGKQDQR